MSDWRFSCENALRRASKEDLGAVAAREGILGLPLSVQSEKANRVYQMASEARKKHQDSLASRRKRLLEPGKTGFGDLDKQFAELDTPAAVASA